MIHALSILRGCVSDLRVAPHNYQVRLRVAEALVALGQRDRGHDIFSSVAEYYALTGFPVRALYSLKLSALYGVDFSMLERGFRLIATHYSARPDRTWSEPMIEAPIARAPLGVAPPLKSTVAELAQEAYERSMERLSGAAFPENLPRLPLLSSLPQEQLLTALRAVLLRRASAGEVVLRAHEPSQVVSILADGLVSVVSPEPEGGAVHLAKLRSGDVFGEMSVITGSPRVASVVAETPAGVLQLPADLFDGDAEGHGNLRQALLEIVRGRLHQNAVRLSSVFSRLEASRGQRFLGEFAVKMVPAGVTLIREGEPVGSVFVVLDGRILVNVGRDDSEETVAELAEGALVGESCFFGHGAAAASCVTGRRCLLLHLSAESARAIALRYDDVVKVIQSVRDDRLLSNAWLSTKAD